MIVLYDELMIYLNIKEGDNMRIVEAKKAVIIMENEPWLNADTIQADVPIEENWKPIGEDYFESENGICGPPKRNDMRIFIDFDRMPKCPLCNGSISTDDTTGILGQCSCVLQDIKGNYRIVT